MRLVRQWGEIERDLPDDWSEARLSLRVADADRAERAAAVLGPLSPGRSGDRIRFFCARGGGGAGPEAVRRALRRLDDERIGGELELVGSAEAARERDASGAAAPTLTASWDTAVNSLPPDWSDLYVQADLRSSDHLERAALMLAPLNPARHDDRPSFRFRVARRFGYGGSAEMARRCFERCDAERITGRVEVLRAVSSSDHVATQGPVWYVGGRSV